MCRVSFSLLDAKTVFVQRGSVLNTPFSPKMLRPRDTAELKTVLPQIPPLNLASMLTFLTAAGRASCPPMGLGLGLGAPSPSCTMTAMHHLEVENLKLWLDPEVVAAHLGSPEKVWQECTPACPPCRARSVSAASPRTHCV